MSQLQDQYHSEMEQDMDTWEDMELHGTPFMELSDGILLNGMTTGLVGNTV